jgi:hypothetical protein
VLATGSVVLDAKTNGVLGIPFIAFAPFIGVAVTDVARNLANQYTLLLYIRN